MNLVIDALACLSNTFRDAVNVYRTTTFRLSISPLCS
jgi:hypothetical protein